MKQLDDERQKDERARDLRALARIVYSEGDRSPHIARLKGALTRYGYLPPQVCDCPPDAFCPHTRRASTTWPPTAWAASSPWTDSGETVGVVGCRDAGT